MSKMKYQQEPIAIIGFACRLPGGNHNPQRHWQFLEGGQVASNKVPRSRFNFEGHYDGSLRPGTMRPSGGIFLEDVDFSHFDAAFFGIGGSEAPSIDPNQRQMLEVVYEGLENAGIPLDKIDGAAMGCFVGSYSSDYADMQNRDASDRPANFALGIGRSIMANRLSYFLNIKGPSITVDTACSGSLVCLDLACRSIQIGEIDSAIIAASNIYLNPDHVMDVGSVGQAQSPTALCHTFDAKADGYVKAEAVNCLIVKRLADALRDRDPIRAIVRGTASNSNGRTAGIASPSSVAQAAAIRAAYANAGISKFYETTYLECHGTGTQAGDPMEVDGIGSVFAHSRSDERPLIIGSIKSNVGHAEPAAGISGLIKAVMSMEKGVIPGTPTFIQPNPKIEFLQNKVKATRSAITWPNTGFAIRRSSINSFGMGGSNAHVIIDQPHAAIRSSYVSSYGNTTDDESSFASESKSQRPYLLMVSANDSVSLKLNIQSLCRYLVDPRVDVNLEDLAYTLSQRRSRLWHRAFVIAATAEIEQKDFVLSKSSGQPPKIALIFTGQGAQWPQMGKRLLETFPWVRMVLEKMDAILQTKSDPPKWSIVTEMTDRRSVEEMRQPEISQTLTTALQLCIVIILNKWEVKISNVIGHSSGEIAAAYASGLLDLGGAITAAFYRGRASELLRHQNSKAAGMLAVGLSAAAASTYIEQYSGRAWLACFNSHDSVTISGELAVLETVGNAIKADGHFSKLLLVDLAYHSPLMNAIGDKYIELLKDDKTFRPLDGSPGVSMFSTINGQKLNGLTDSSYWKDNLLHPVRFDETLKNLVADEAPDMLIEVGPSGALAGPVAKVIQNLKSGGHISYLSAWSRGTNAPNSLFSVAGHLFSTGASVDMSKVNDYNMASVRTIVDLPNYSWNHSVNYWHENTASKDWRFKRFITHDLLGSKIPGTLWTDPTWRAQVTPATIPWIRDHVIGSDILMPGAGYVTLALEAMYQTYCALTPDHNIRCSNELAYRFRNVRFERAMVLEENKTTTILLTLNKLPTSGDWYQFQVQTVDADIIYKHCTGMIQVHSEVLDNTLPESDRAPLKYPQPSVLWYKAQREAGMDFGPSFQKIECIESTRGKRTCRSILSLEPPASEWIPSYYPLHPAVLDACFQTVHPANVSGDRSGFADIMIPSVIDDLVINKKPQKLQKGLSVADSVYSGRGRKDVAKSWAANIDVYDPNNGALVMSVKGLNYIKLDVDKPIDPHAFQRSVWRPDISLLDQSQLSSVLTEAQGDNAQIQLVIDLVAHKYPKLRVLEMNLDDTDTSSLWFTAEENATRATYARYDALSADASSTVSMQETYRSRRNATFHLMPLSGGVHDIIDSPGTYDLVIVKTPAADNVSPINLQSRVEAVFPRNGIAIVVHQGGRVLQNGSNGDLHKESKDAPRIPIYLDDMANSINSTGISTLRIGNQSAWLLRNNERRVKPSTSLPVLEIVQFDTRSFVFCNDLKSGLQGAGWASCITPLDQFDAQSVASLVLVVDELLAPVLSQISETQWEGMKRLICSGKSIFWMAKGAHTSAVTDPDNALIQGIFRTARRERPDAQLTILDVGLTGDSSTRKVLEQVLRKIHDSPDTDTEYAERNGVPLVERLMLDTDANDFKAFQNGLALPTITGNIYNSEQRIQLRAEKVGSLESLAWTETTISNAQLPLGMAEIDVVTVGVNFKDVAITMGLVPDNEHLIGCECAGYIRNLSPDVTKFRIGDRVVAQVNGTYANRVTCPIKRMHMIPSGMSFEDAATIPLVYLTAIYGLYHLANLKEGQTVLIHSAAGGVGIAAIQLARFKKAEVFVTVSADEKRQFLAHRFGIPSSHMSSSRSAEFAKKFRHQTKGQGIDVVLNSLTGELLDESWRLLADGGILIEIGKRDILDKNLLSMEPFDRNCSYRALDLSYTREITDELISRLLEEIFCLVESGHIKPIQPIKRFAFDQVVQALTYMKRGQHIGKIVISSEERKDVQVPIRPLPHKLCLRSDVTYLIVGGLKGLCGSVAVHMARNGARHLLVMSRSGLADEMSAKVMQDCAAYDCEVLEAKGDVGDRAFVRRIFDASYSGRQIAGIIQGAMVLRDRPFEAMTSDEYHTAIRGKVTGTWNLHHAADELSASATTLDFFTLLSSISRVVGNKGQSNYAAANRFLDSFAHYRRSMGLCASVVDLGAVEDIGYIAEQGSALADRFDKHQWVPINEKVLRNIISYSIQQQLTKRPSNESTGAQLITGLAYPLSDESELLEDPRFSYLFNGYTNHQPDILGSGDSTDIGRGIKAFRTMHAAGGQVTDLVDMALGLLQSQVAKLLQIETEVDSGRPLMVYGLDSLSAVELRGWIRQKLGAELSTLDITNASSLRSLSEKLVTKLM